MQDSIHERNDSGSLNYSNAFKKELMNQSEQFNMSGEINSDREGANLAGGFDIESVIVRRADGDDYFAIEKMIDNGAQDALDLIYNYPKLLHLLETSFLSMTVLDTNLQPMGVLVFNDYPPGLEGMYDYKHENAWELWLDRAYNLTTDYNIRPFNCLWVTYAYIDRYTYKLDTKAEVAIIKKVFQNVYGTFPNVEGICFMLRGESKRELGTTHPLYQSFKSELFQEMEVKDREVLKKVRGVHFESSLYFSPRDVCLDYVEIRIAKQEDHDDLAGIFNSQSEVLTAQFGEFFIAELIAFQNQDQKALVAQVKDKAVGLMSISKDIDYRLLAEGFELDPYDNLLKGDFMDALRYRRLDIVDEENYAKIDEKRAIQRKIRDEKFRCSLLGQRLALQQYCITKEADLKQQLDDYLTVEEKTKALTKDIVQEIIDKWLDGFKLTQPHEIFYEQGVSDSDIFAWIIGERDFFLETLTFYGLPKDYILGMGHHKDWARKQLEKKKSEAMRRGPMANKMKKAPKKKKGQEEKKEEFGPPPYFDLEPFMIAFNRFVASGPQVRALFRDLMVKNKQQIILLFSNEEGELINERIMDIYALPSAITSQNIALAMADVVPGLLECFGDIKYDLKILLKNPLEENEKPQFKKVQTTKDKEKDAKGKKVTKDSKKQEPEKEKKEDKEKEIEQTKEPEKEAPKEEQKEVDPLIAKLTIEASKPVEYIEKYTSYDEILDALEKITLYDQMLCELGIIESVLVQREVNAKVQKEEQEYQEEMDKRKRYREENDYDALMQDVMEKDGFPEIPLSAHNAIVINLFCIDDPYESRSIDFLFYAFEQFPDREYIILTQPHTINESTLLQSFVQVSKKKNSVFEDVLYIFHKDALFASMISVTRTQVEEISLARPLYAYMPNADDIEKDIVEAVKSLTSNNIAFTAHIDETIIGIYVISKDVNLLYYKSHFSIQDFMLIDQHSRAGHAKVVHAVLNPIFKKATRYILKEVMRLSNKTAFYFETTNKTVLPDIFNDLILTRSRKFPHLLERKWDHENDPEYLERFMDRKLVVDGERDPYDQKESDFALSVITKKLLSINKVNNNYRIVVIGGSDTGVSFVESLLSVRYVNFPHITLLAPGGIHSMHVNTEYTQLKATSPNYTLYELKNLMLDARVTVLDARMVNIDRKKKNIHLDKKAVVPYDVLVLTVGLIDNQLFEFEDEHLVSEGIGKVNEKYEIFQDRRYIKGVFSLDDPYIHDLFSPNAGPGSPIDLLTRRKRVQNIMVYGRSLHCFCFINGLLNRGVKPERINFVIPPRKYEKPAKFESNEQKWEHEDHKVHDPDAFEDPKVEEIVLKVFESMGIKVYTDYFLADIRSDEQNNIESIKFRRPESEEDDEPEELEEPCKILVTSRHYDIDPVIFACIHDNGLVYNGRLIVKSNFQTTDESIFAAGRLCEFSQRYKNTAVGTSLKLDKYSSREIGQKLSRCVLEYIGLLAPALEPGQEEEDLPLFFMPVGTCGVLPNDLFYYYIRKIDWAKPKKAFQNDAVYRKDLISNNLDKQFRGHFIKFTFDSYGIIDSVTYLGTERISVQSLSSFVGLAETYLNQLTSRFKKGLIDNITEFLSENWSMALYHEWFSLFRHQIKLEMAAKDSLEKVFKKLSKKAKQGKYVKKGGWKKYKEHLEKDVIKAIEDGSLDFIRENLNHLPMYYIPGEEFP